MGKQQGLETRPDLFDRWKLHEWFAEHERLSPEFREHMFRTWMDLFLNLYNDLTERVRNAERRDEYFMHFVNVVFPNLIDEYKWLESEKQGTDIGLLAALDGVSNVDWFIERLTSFSLTY